MARETLITFEIHGHFPAVSGRQLTRNAVRVINRYLVVDGHRELHMVLSKYHPSGLPTKFEVFHQLNIYFSCIPHDEPQ